MNFYWVLVFDFEYFVKFYVYFCVMDFLYSKFGGRR